MASMKTGIDAYQRGDYKTALDAFKSLAKKGDATAQYLLSELYYKGLGVSQDYYEAAKWCESAMQNGDDSALIRLGIMYKNGHGFTQNYSLAVEWLRRAAKKNFAEAQFHFGDMYYNGWGVEQDYNEAASLYAKAAYQGHIEAQFKLSGMHQNGEISGGIDYFKAYIWATLAAATGHQVAEVRRNHIAEEMTPDKIAEAQEIASTRQSKIKSE